MSCRFSGGSDSKDKFWSMLTEGGCGVGPYPKNRIYANKFEESYNPGKGTPGKHYVLIGAFLDKIMGFDSQFFGISSDECRSMDPQQRLLLHVVYEAIEDAGLHLEDLQQCQTGVYCGLMNLDYGNFLLDKSNIRNINQFASTGVTYSVTANRISYLLNLTGPSLTVDTACSSSQTALHLAFGHLQTGEIDVAIVCAPNIWLDSTRFHIACCKTAMLAEDGRCKSFDIKGDGYGRGEGIAAVILKPSLRAIDDRDDIYAEIVASGINNDGQSAIPMTSPSESSQTELFKKVLDESELSKDDITYVEAHGTGTAVGDVVEMASISSVYGNSSKRILRVGSVKSNINHTEAAAGLAGLIKTCLMIKHASLVPTINVQQEKPQLKMSERKMMVQRKYEPWRPEEGKPRIAALCSYGYGGANAHLIVREVSQNSSPCMPNSSRLNWILTLTARSGGALRMLAKLVSQKLNLMPDDDELLKDNICYSFNERYTLHSHRLAVTFGSFKQAAKSLETYGNRENGGKNLITDAETSTTRKKVVFLYGGQGIRWYGMAREMIKHEPTFKKSIEKIDKVLKKFNVHWSLSDELSKPEELSRIMENCIGQTALFGIHFALTELLKSWGITPSAVLGYSLGEISAACAAGALSLQESLQLVLTRSMLHDKCSATGSMLAVSISDHDANNLLESLGVNNVSIAVINSPTDVVLSGDKESIEVVEKHIREKHNGLFLKNIATTRAFHSHEMEQIKQEFLRLTSSNTLKPLRENIPLYSTVTGSQVFGKELVQGHWWNNIRQTVLFYPALDAILDDGYRTFIEINAAPQLSRHVQTIWMDYRKGKVDNASDVVVIQTLPKRTETEQHRAFLHNCVAHLFTSGVPIMWHKIQGSGSKLFIKRPNYPWQETDYWFHDKPLKKIVGPFGEKSTKEENATKTHPLLGKAVSTEAFSGLLAWENDIELYKLPYLKDHAFTTSTDPVVPAAAYVEMIFAMMKHMFPEALPNVHEISFRNILTISSNDSFVFRTRLTNTQGWQGPGKFQITKMEDDENEVILCDGSVSFDIAEKEKIPERGDTSSEIEYFQLLKSRMIPQKRELIDAKRRAANFQFGENFCLIADTWSNEREAFALIIPTDEILKTSSSYVIHPCIIDACLQSTLLVPGSSGHSVPHQIKTVNLQRHTITTQLYCYVKAIQYDERTYFNVTLMDCFGHTVMLLKECFLVDITSVNFSPAFHDSALVVGWHSEELSADRQDVSAVRRWIILQDESGFGQAFVDHLPVDSSVTVVDLPVTTDEITRSISNALIAAQESLDNGGKVMVLNFWPIDASQFGGECQHFTSSHFLSFESSLLCVQAIIDNLDLVENVHLVLVTMELATVILSDNSGESKDLLLFPWAATVVGLRRNISIELSTINSTLIDLPKNPSFSDYKLMVNDLIQKSTDDEITYRKGSRFVSNITRLYSEKFEPAKEESLRNACGESVPLQLSFASNKIFLRKRIMGTANKKVPLLAVEYVNPLFNSTWSTLKPENLVALGGTVSHSSKAGGKRTVFGICIAGNLGNYVDVDKCCLVDIIEGISSKQAAVLYYPLAMSEYIIKEILQHVKGRKIFVYHREPEMSCVFALLILAMGAEAICLVDDEQEQNQLKEVGISETLRNDELLMDDALSSLDFDAACFLSRPSEAVYLSVAKKLKTEAKVVIVTDEFNASVHVPVHSNNGMVITINPGIFINHSPETLSCLLSSCTKTLILGGYFEKLLGIPVSATSVYDIVGIKNSSLSQTFKGKSSGGLLLQTFSFIPSSVPESAMLYSLPFDSQGLRSSSSYLVVGGIQGFGFEVARWLIKNGARLVMCTARSAPSEEKLAEVQSLEQKFGCRIFLRQADTTSLEEMKVVIEELESVAPVAGIVFSAMVLHDQLIKEADLESCRRVVSTKVQGSVVLHNLSLSMKLDFFIVFSSLTGVLGNIGQASYAAANTFLDSLCEYRRFNLGLPALSVDWGAISGTGVLARLKNVSVALDKQGISSLHFTTGLEYLKRFLTEHPDKAQVCLCNMNWPVYFEYLTNIPTRLRSIRNEYSLQIKFQGKTTLRELSLVPPPTRIEYLEEFVRSLLSTWSGTSAKDVDLNAGLYRIGVDSMGATTMAIRIRDALGATLENYFFVQPKTTGRSIINEILHQIESFDANEQVPLHETTASNSHLSNEGKTPLTPLGHLRNETVDQQDETHEAKVVPLYVPDEPSVNVFLVHPSLRSALSNALFASGFQQQTLVALYSIGFASSIHPINNYGTVPFLAEKYVCLIRQKQSKGPYYIGGYSFGGMVAYEIASLLTKEDEDVAMLFLLDTYPWFPKQMVTRREMFSFRAAKTCQETVTTLVGELIHKLACIGLGMTSDEYNRLNEELTTEELLGALEERAKDKHFPFNIREEISIVKYEIKCATIAHLDWQPHAVRFSGLITYVRCEENKRVPFFWDGPSTWKSLTGKIDILCMPGEHLHLQQDEDRARLAGTLLMTTAAIKHMSKRSLSTFIRSHREQRQVDWLKTGTSRLMYSSKESSRSVNGTVWLDQDETLLYFCAKHWGLKVTEKLFLKDVHNIVPGKYVDVIRSQNHVGDVDLVFCILTNNGDIHKFKCLDHDHLNEVMSSLEGLFLVPLTRVHNFR